MHKERFETVLPDQLRRRYRSPAPPPPYIRREVKRSRIPWIGMAGALACLALITAGLLLRQNVSSPPAIPAPTPTPVPIPTPIPLLTPEVRKAGYVLHRELLMPYGEKLMTRYLGSVPNQESLPLTGNHIGDTYQVGPYEFVWVSPGVWIDPLN